MTTDHEPAAGERQPGERRLARPPSERYRDDPTREIEPGPPANGSTIRLVGSGLVAVLGVAAAISVLGGIVLVTAGLLAVAALGGWAIAVAVRAGAGAAVPRSRQTTVAVALAALAVLGGQLGLWLIGRAEGGVLGPVEYLADTFGILVPLEVAAAMLAAWLAAR